MRPMKRQEYDDWDCRDERHLELWFGFKPLKEIAQDLDRTPEDVRERAALLHLRQRRREETLCICCRHATNATGICCWAREGGTPVPGWTAKPGRVRIGSYTSEEYLDSYQVIKCPLFEVG